LAVSRSQAIAALGRIHAVAYRLNEWPLTALCSRWLTTCRMGEDAPKPPSKTFGRSARPRRDRTGSYANGRWHRRRSPTRRRLPTNCLKRARRRLLHLLKITGLPGSIEGRSIRAVQAEVDEPAVSGIGLDPLPFFTGRRVGAEVEIGRSRRRNIFQLNQRPTLCGREQDSNPRSPPGGS